MVRRILQNLPNETISLSAFIKEGDKGNILIVKDDTCLILARFGGTKYVFINMIQPLKSTSMENLGIFESVNESVKEAIDKGYKVYTISNNQEFRHFILNYKELQ